MSTEKWHKINKLLISTPRGIVYTSKWLTKLGYNSDLQKRYRKSNWFESIGRGALIRTGDTVDYIGGIYALQKQLDLSIHLGSMSSLALQGRTHFLLLQQNRIELFGEPNEKLPSWWHNHDWGAKINFRTSNFLPKEMGKTTYERLGYSILISNKVRAMMELLLVPKAWSLLSSYEIMIGLNDLRPYEVQKLLENCSSIKVKRLFLYLAEKANHEWFHHIDQKYIDLGTGKRSFIENGTYIKKYMIVVPKEMEDGTI